MKSFEQVLGVTFDLSSGITLATLAISFLIAEPLRNLGKYTFAEMEEGEQDLEKLARWLTKIRERDFFPDEHRQQSATMLARCRSVLDGFSQAVYIAEGVQEAADSATPDQAPLGSSELSGRGWRARNLPARSADHGPNRNNYRLSPI